MSFCFGEQIALQEVPTTILQRPHDQEGFEGTGVPFANVSKIVEPHGGRAWADSEEGKGVSIFLALPDAKRSEVERNRQCQALEWSAEQG
jgi:light-regulated signal transduction histidine kinase (bacteriophytochrome)